MTQARPAVARGTVPGWVPFGALVGIEFLTVMDASVVNIALPAIKADLGYGPTEISWVVNSYLIAFAGLLLTAGRLSDAVGRRRLFVVGTVVFAAASVGCGLAVEPWHLVAGRVVQGLGAALVVPAALALITDIVPEGPARVRALGIFAGVGAVAAPLGLVLGGLLTEIDWHLIFWINVPLGAVITAIALTTLPASAPTPARVDLLGAVAAVGTLSLLALAAVSLAPGGSTASTIVPAVGALALGIVLVHRQRRAAHPLIPPELLRNRSIVLGNGIFVLVGTVLLGTFFFVTLYLQETRDLAPLQATIAYLPIPLAMYVGTRLAPWLIRARGPHGALGVGLLVQAVALGCFAVLSQTNGFLVTALIAPTVPWATGLGISIVSSFVVCTSGVRPAVAGGASGLATTAYQGGGAVGLALVAALGMHAGVWALAGAAMLGAVLTRMLPRGEAAGS